MEIEQLVEEYIQHLRVERDLSPWTVQNYRSDLRRFPRTVDSQGDGRQPESVTRQTIRKHIVALRDQGLVSRSIARHISRLRAFWSFCVDNGYAPENPVAGISVPKRPRKLPGYLSEDQCRKLLGSAAQQTNPVKAFRDVAVVTTLLHCGLRRAELLALTVREVDLQSANIRVVEGKGRKSRVLPLTPQATSALADWLEMRPDAVTDRLSRSRGADHFVIEPVLWVPTVVHRSDWGLAPEYRASGQARGSVVWEAPLTSPSDVARLRKPIVSVDTEATGRRLDALRTELGEWFEVREHCALPHANMIGEATQLRGLRQVLVDMHDAPAFLHELMGFIADAVVGTARTLEAEGRLTLNNGHHYNDSGGIGLTDDLPAKEYDGGPARLRDLWGFGVAQEADGVGPDQHEEFILEYQLRLLEHCGLNAYGCCEPYTHKFAMLRRVPRLRRVSVSPWCDTERAVEEMGRDVVVSWKPNPALLVGRVDPERIRGAVRAALEAARGCAIEIVLKDTFTLESRPERLDLFGRIAREEIDRAVSRA